jgi:hypothetical protein
MKFVKKRGMRVDNLKNQIAREENFESFCKRIGGNIELLPTDIKLCSVDVNDLKEGEHEVLAEFFSKEWGREAPHGLGLEIVHEWLLGRRKSYDYAQITTLDKRGYFESQLYGEEFSFVPLKWDAIEGEKKIDKIKLSGVGDVEDVSDISWGESIAVTEVKFEKPLREMPKDAKTWDMILDKVHEFSKELEDKVSEKMAELEKEVRPEEEEEFV